MNSHKASSQLSLTAENGGFKGKYVKGAVNSVKNETWTRLKKGVARTTEEGRGYLSTGGKARRE